MSDYSKRSFAYRDPPRNNKFWTVEVIGLTVLVTFGRIGSNGTTQVKTFPTARAAQTHADDLAREKERKGYRREGASHPGAPELQVTAVTLAAGGAVAAAPVVPPTVSDGGGRRRLDL